MGIWFPFVHSARNSYGYRCKFDVYRKRNEERLKGLIPRERRAVYSLTHLFLPWVYEIVSNPNILFDIQ
jgi:hypothetical protein